MSSASSSPSDHHPKRKRSISPPQPDVHPPPNTRKRLSPNPQSPNLPTPSLEPIKMNIPRIHDDDPARRREREDQLRIRLAEQELSGIVKPTPDPKMEMQKMAATRAGGAYIPPARLKALQAQLELDDPSSPEYQRMRWDALRKSINGLINKVNIANIKFIVPELFGENLIRGRGLFVRSIMRAQASSLPFTPVFAALVSIINTKLPTVGELLVTRVVSQFRRAYRRNDKITCVATTIFVAQLVNQQVAHHLLAFEMIILLLEKPTDDSVEIAVGFTKEVGAFLSEAEPKANNSVYERFRSILHEATISKRVQYMIEVLFQVRKDRFKDNPVLPEGLDLVEEDDIITHPIHLDDDLQVQEGLNVYKFDPDFIENEEKYTSIKNEILGLDSDSDSSGSDSGSDESSESEADPETGIVNGKVEIHDHTGTNLINFRRNIYLTIMSSLDFEEAAHKLLKSNIEEGLELELANMVVECCSQERSFAKFYGLLGERFCKLNQNWTMTFDQCFRNYYDTIHRFETNRLRNIARFFGHLLAQDAIPWTCFEVIKMNEDDTTSSSRIFVKIMFQELSEVLGLKRLAERFKEPPMQVWYAGLFPIDNPKNTRFSINYFTSIGLGVLTEEMREHLKRAPQIIMAKRRELEDAESSSDDSSSDISSTDSSSESDSSSDNSDESSDVSYRRSSRQRDDKSGRRERSPRVSPSPVRRRGTRYSSSESRSPSPPPRRRSPPRENRDGRSHRGDARDRESPIRKPRNDLDRRTDGRKPSDRDDGDRRRRDLRDDRRDQGDDRRRDYEKTDRRDDKDRHRQTEDEDGDRRRDHRKADGRDRRRDEPGRDNHARQSRARDGVDDDELAHRDDRSRRAKVEERASRAEEGRSTRRDDVDIDRRARGSRQDPNASPIQRSRTTVQSSRRRSPNGASRGEGRGDRRARSETPEDEEPPRRRLRSPSPINAKARMTINPARAAMIGR